MFWVVLNNQIIYNKFLSVGFIQVFALDIYQQEFTAVTLKGSQFCNLLTFNKRPIMPHLFLKVYIFWIILVKAMVYGKKRFTSKILECSKTFNSRGQVRHTINKLKWCDDYFLLVGIAFLKIEFLRELSEFMII